MFYTMYLASVCQRRQWPEPLYEPFQNGRGYYCKVRVNNREYSTDVPYESETLARDGAAQRAYMICRNFSANDGMVPGQRPGQASSSGIIQGLPVAIGAGRRSNRSSGSSYDTAGSSSEAASSLGGDSPKSIDSSLESQMLYSMAQQQQQMMMRLQPRPRRVASRTLASNDGYVCLCRRGPVHAYGRCNWCLKENGWA